METLARGGGQLGIKANENRSNGLDTVNICTSDLRVTVNPGCYLWLLSDTFYGWLETDVNDSLLSQTV